MHTVVCTFTSLSSDKSAISTFYVFWVDKSYSKRLPWLTDVSLLTPGQAVSAPSHPRGARPGEGGCDRSGPAGSVHTEAHPAVRCLTQAWMLCAVETFPKPIAGTREPLQGEDPVAGGFLLLPDWNGKQKIEIFVCSYDVSSKPLPVHHVLTRVLFLVNRVIPCVWTRYVFPKVRTLDLLRRDGQDNGSTGICGFPSSRSVVIESVPPVSLLVLDNNKHSAHSSMLLHYHKPLTDLKSCSWVFFPFLRGVDFYSMRIIIFYSVCIRCLIHSSGPFNSRAWFLSSADLFAKHCIWAMISALWW